MAALRFRKMHGAGNDFVVLDRFEALPVDPAVAARLLADRHFGVGCDQVLVVGPSDVATAKMEIYNQDGSRAEMCGNGIRCIARYLHDYRGVSESPMTIETLAGPIQPELVGERVRVNMGRPRWAAGEIPVRPERFGLGAGDAVLQRPLTVGDRSYELTCVSVGNPHAVMVVDSATLELTTTVGPGVETHPAFPNRTNVEFAEIVDAGHINLRVWERGAGATLACGTGAVATVAALARNGLTGRHVMVRLPGGVLEIEWGQDDTLWMTGPAEDIYGGEIELAAIERGIGLIRDAEHV